MDWERDLLNEKMEGIARDFVVDEISRYDWNIEAAARRFCITKDEFLSVLKPKTEAILTKV